MAIKAPPVYRPQPIPKVLQTKARPGQPAPSATGQKAPAVYRPQPTPKVLQRTALPAHKTAQPAARPTPPGRTKPTSRPSQTVQAKRPLAPSRSNTIQAMFVDPMPAMESQWQFGVGLFVDLNCGWYCQSAAIRHWVSKLHLTCPPDILPKTSVAAFSPGKDGKSLATGYVKPTTAAGWETLLSVKGPITVAGQIGGADWGMLGGIGHFVLIVGADATADTISYLDPLQGNTLKTEDFQHVYGRMSGSAYAIKLDVLYSLCQDYEKELRRREETRRQRWLDVVRRRWERRTTDTVNDSEEGSLYVTNDML